ATGSARTLNDTHRQAAGRRSLRPAASLCGKGQAPLGAWPHRVRVLGRLVQARDVWHPCQLGEAFDLELPHPLAGEADLAADHVEVHGLATGEAVAKLEHAPGA